MQETWASFSCLAMPLGMWPAMTLNPGYRYEKFGAIALARWFESQDYHVRLSVTGPPCEVVYREDLGGIEPPELTPEDFSDPRRRYEIYYDSPGHIDLAARNDQELWLVEAKGLIKGGSAPSAVAGALGQIVIMMRPEIERLRYGVLLPKEDRFVRIVTGMSPANPLLSRGDFSVFWVRHDGEIEVAHLGKTLSRQ